MHDFALKLASLLGTSIAGTLFFWPIVFVAVKNSLRLTYRWAPFLAGFFCTVALNSLALAAASFLAKTDATSLPVDGPDSFNWFTVLCTVGLPLISSLVIALSTAPVFHAARANSSVISAQTPQSSDPVRQRAMRTWTGVGTYAGLVAGILCFPPWVVTRPTGPTLRVGWGSLMGPQDRAVTRAASSCDQPVAEAQRAYAAAQASDRQMQQPQAAEEEARAEAAKAIPLLKARGLDPDKVDIAGNPLHCERLASGGESCDRLSANTLLDAETPFASENTADAALSALQGAERSCASQVRELSSEAHIDFATVLYELVAATVLVGATLIVMVLRPRARGQAENA